MENYSLSDIASITKGNDGLFGGAGGGGMWIFALLILLLIGGGGGFGFGNTGNAVQQADLQRAIDLNSIQEGQAGINSNIQRIGYENMGTIKDVAYNNLSEIRDIQNVVNNGFANMQTCCCGLDKSIMENRYLDAQNTASINAVTTAQTQKILDAMAQDKIATLSAQVSELKTQNMFCGIPRINPYGYGISPQFATGCGCGNTVI